jgi:phosphate transport system substrate-binding protein|nr:phosphate ABC transporter substrate-binding protein PstS [uncultured Rhodopila sp.]
MKSVTTPNPDIRALRYYAGERKLAVMIVAASLTGFSVSARAQSQITGAGSTFGAPIYSKWGAAAAGPTGVELNYQPLGSGAGINQINNRTVDFGASDMPVAAAELNKNKLMQFPTVVGGVDIIVNIPGIKPNVMQLTGPVLAQIYLGNITKWNDAAIKTLNPGMDLPALAIAPVYRADGSGTTFVFTDYLSMLSPIWKAQVGSSTDVKWAAGTGAKGTDGVAAMVSNTRGAIGYVESAYAWENKLTTTKLQNASGKFVAPTMKSYTAAAAAADWSKVQNFAVDLNNEPGADSWPIESATFVLLPINPDAAAQSAAVVKFFDWSFTKGNDLATQLQYISLPDSVHQAVRAAWKAKLPGGKS